MPRPNRGRVVRAERNVAARVRLERQARRWTLEGLAKRMSDAGCPINASAIYKIESSDPPRRVTVDELVAMSLVFGIDVSDLIVPIEFVNNKRAKELYGKVEENFRKIAEGSDGFLRALLAYIDTVRHDPDLARLVDDLWFGDQTGTDDDPSSETRSLGQIVADDGTVLADDIPGLREALSTILVLLIKSAEEIDGLMTEARAGG